MAGDLAGRRDPYIVSSRRDMREGSAQMPQTMGLADDIGMKRNAHDEGGVAALFEHFLELIDDHVGEGRSLHSPRDDGGNIVELLWIGNAEDPSPAGAEPNGLIVHAPVQQVTVAGLLQQTRRLPTLRDPWAKPPLGRLAFMAGQDFRRLLDQCAFIRLAEHALFLGICPAMADDLIAALTERAHEVGREIIHG